MDEKAPYIESAPLGAPRRNGKMKVYQPTMPVALSKLKAGDLYYTIDGDKSVLAMRVEEEASDHPYFVRLRVRSHFSWRTVSVGSIQSFSPRLISNAESWDLELP